MKTTGARIKGRKTTRGPFKRLLWVFFFTFFLFPSPGRSAKVHPEAGATSATFLKLGVSPRAIAMGGAYTAVADDVYAPQWNPAGLIQLDHREFGLMHNKYFQDLNQEFFGYALPLPPESAVQIQAQGLFMPRDFERRSGVGEEIPTAPLTAPEGKFSAHDWALTGSYARRLGPSWSLGLGAKYIRQEIDNELAFGLAADLGFLWRAPGSPYSLGMSLQNLGPAMRFREKYFLLPMNARIGAAYRSPKDRLILALDLTQPYDNYVASSLGMEYRLSKLLSLRAGYHYRLHDNELDALSGLGAGLGIHFKGIRLDYAFAPYGDLGDSHRVGLLVRFQPPPEKEKAAAPPTALEEEVVVSAVPIETPAYDLTTTIKLLRLSSQKRVHEVLAVSGPDTAVQRLFFRTDSPVPSDLNLSLEEETDPGTLPEPALRPFKVYKLLGNTVRVSGRMGVAFRIPKSWLEQEGVDPGRVALYAWDGQKWEKQPTRVLSNGGADYEFRSDVVPTDRWLLGAPAQ